MHEETDDIIELMTSHRTIRRFSPAPVPEAVIKRAVAAAQCAATSHAIQAYALIQVTAPGERQRLAELCGNQAQVHEAGAFFVLCVDQRRHALVNERAGLPLATNLESFLVGVIDASLFAQNLILACEDAGLGTCCIGGLRSDLSAVDELLELPSGLFPIFGLCVGTPADSSSTRPRLPLAGVLFQDRYGSDAEVLAAIDAHDREAAAWYARRGAPGRNWSASITRLLSQATRTELAEYYSRKGANFA
ncbi:MAG TPA: nitroreductase family protein [Planctomycetota bacterium]|jgi:nitroreductase|nr:nitroreductase family protein [Planctomycetota bacterium]